MQPAITSSTEHGRGAQIALSATNRDRPLGRANLAALATPIFGCTSRNLGDDLRRHEGQNSRGGKALHNGRGAQEAIFAELKSQTQMDYIPYRRRAANQTWLLAAIMAHNLNRELQMSVEKPARCTTEQRAPWWSFVRLGTRRMRLIQRAGRLTTPKGRLTLTLSANPDVQAELLHYLRAAA